MLILCLCFHCPVPHSRLREAKWGAASAPHAGLFDVAVVLDLAVGLHTGLLLESLLERCRYARALPVLRDMRKRAVSEVW